MLEDTPPDSSRASRVRAFLPRGMGDRDVTGARSGPLGSIAPGGAEAAAAAAAAATAAATSAVVATARSPAATACAAAAFAAATTNHSAPLHRRRLRLRLR